MSALAEALFIAHRDRRAGWVTCTREGRTSRLGFREGQLVAMELEFGHQTTAQALLVANRLSLGQLDALWARGDALETEPEALEELGLSVAVAEAERACGTVRALLAQSEAVRFEEAEVAPRGAAVSGAQVVRAAWDALPPGQDRDGGGGDVVRLAHPERLQDWPLSPAEQAWLTTLADWTPLRELAPARRSLAALLERGGALERLEGHAWQRQQRPPASELAPTAGDPEAWAAPEVSDLPELEAEIARARAEVDAQGQRDELERAQHKQRLAAQEAPAPLPPETRPSAPGRRRADSADLARLEEAMRRAEQEALAGEAELERERVEAEARVQTERAARERAEAEALARQERAMREAEEQARRAEEHEQALEAARQQAERAAAVEAARLAAEAAAREEAERAAAQEVARLAAEAERAAAQEAARQAAEEEAREEAERAAAQETARLGAEEEAARLEAERAAAQEAARLAAEEEAARLEAERAQAQAEANRQAARARAEADARQLAEQARARATAEARARAEESRARAQAEARRIEEARRRAEEAERARVEQEAQAAARRQAEVARRGTPDPVEDAQRALRQREQKSLLERMNEALRQSTYVGPSPAERPVRQREERTDPHLLVPVAALPSAPRPPALASGQDEDGDLWSLVQSDSSSEALPAVSSFEEALQQIDSSLESLVAEPLPASPILEAEAVVEAAPEPLEAASSPDPDAARLRRQRLLRRSRESLGGAPSGVSAPPLAPPPAPPAAAPPPATIPDQQLAAQIEARHEQLRRKDYFGTLGLGTEATRDQVRAAFLSLAKVFHPDRLPPSLPHLAQKLSAVFDSIREAYEVLHDDARRSAWLATRTAMPSAQPVTSGQQASELVKMGEAYFKKRDYRQAEEHFARAHALDRAGASLAAQAWAISMDPTRKAEGPQALAMMLQAIALDPTCDRAHYQLGVIARVEGDMEGADQHFREAVRVNPRHLEANQELRLIDLRRKKNDPGGGRRGGGFFR